MTTEREQLELKFTRRCYVCKKEHYRPHSGYRYLCETCGALNAAKRAQTADLSGRVCVLTGARVKIGYETGLKLLRAGARLIATSRFPFDAMTRYSTAPDYDDWKERLTIHGVDFRQTKAVETLIASITERHEKLDIIINNAAQTVRRPPLYYRHLISNETAHRDTDMNGFLVQSTVGDSNGTGMSDSIVPTQMVSHHLGTGRSGPCTAAELSQIPLLPDDETVDPAFFPPDTFDKDGQQADRRPFNSWMMTLDAVPLVEMMEVFYINVVAPFLLNTKLRPLMKRTADAAFIINVSSMEGNFHDPKKNARHPHTNMAKAALNMMTRTSAEDFARDNIYMNSVDTGWITNEKPFPLACPSAERLDEMPIDAQDGAARICDPIFGGIANRHYPYGKLFKNYGVYPW